MAIAVKTLFNEWMQAEGLTESQRLQAVFLRALNRSILDLNADCFQTLDKVTSIESGSIDLDDEWEQILVAGVRCFISESRELGKDPDPYLRELFRQAKTTGRRLYWASDELWGGSNS